MNALVSVIVPIYNERNYLRRCIDSIVSQSYDNIEIILVDDGSINEVAEVCEEYKSKDNRVKVIHKKNEGLSSARISGLDIATGEWIMFVDNDDIINPEAIALLIDNISNECDICIGKRIDLVDVDEYKFDNKSPIYELISGIDAVEMIPEDINGKITTPLWGKIYKSSFLKGFDLCKYKSQCPTIYFEDVFMTPILLSKAKIVRLVDKVIYVHREVSTSISRSGKIGKFYFEQAITGDILLEYCRQNDLNSYYNYYIKIYYKTLLRNHCLLREYNGDIEEKDIIEKSIIDSFQKWKSEFCSSDAPIILKIACELFGINPNLFSQLTYKIYFRGRKING